MYMNVGGSLLGMICHSQPIPSGLSNQDPESKLFDSIKKMKILSCC